MATKNSKSIKNTMESQAMLISATDSQLYLKKDESKSSSEDDLHITKKEASRKTDDREKWSGKLDFFFSGLGYAVGLSNVWRFPYLCYKNGGGAFLVAYSLSVVFGAIPMFFLEVSLGQFMSKGGPSTWGVSPIFKGLGFSSAVMCFLCDLYYIVLLAWSIYYLLMSLRFELPWASCDNWWNTENCITPFQNHHDINKTIEQVKSSTDEFWQLNVLRKTDSFEEIGGIRWELFVCLALSWIAIYFCIFKGIKWTGRLVYFTSTFPFVLLLIILVRGLTLDGAWDGIKYLFIPDWNHLKSSEVKNYTALVVINRLTPKHLEILQKLKKF